MPYVIQFDVDFGDTPLDPKGVYHTGNGFEGDLSVALRYISKDLATEDNRTLLGGTVLEAPPSPRELFLEFLEDPPSSIVDIREEFMRLFPEDNVRMSRP